MAERFHANCELAPGLVVLTGPEAHHLSVVCRLRPGDAVTLFNGDGHEYPGTVEGVSKKTVEVQVREVLSPVRERPFRLIVAAALPKGDRAQFLVEKLTELGASDLVPLSTNYSVVQPREARLDKLKRSVIEASKQCGRNVLMQVQPLQEWRTFCQRGDLLARKLLAHPGGGLVGWGSGEAVVAVGPEGGFTQEEVQLGQAAGWQVVGLGPRILRIETAALALAVLCDAPSEPPSPQGVALGYPPRAPLGL